MCVLNFFCIFSPVCMIKAFFMTVTSIPNFVAEASPSPCLICSRPPCDMISQAVSVIEMMNGLEKSIKTFCYKRVHRV